MVPITPAFRNTRRCTQRGHCNHACLLGPREKPADTIRHAAMCAEMQTHALNWVVLFRSVVAWKLPKRSTGVDMFVEQYSVLPDGHGRLAVGAILSAAHCSGSSLGRSRCADRPKCATQPGPRVACRHVSAGFTASVCSMRVCLSLASARANCVTPSLTLSVWSVPLGGDYGIQPSTPTFSSRPAAYLHFLVDSEEQHTRPTNLAKLLVHGVREGASFCVVSVSEAHAA